MATSSPPYPLTREIAEFAATIGNAPLPEGAADVVRLGFTDCLAVLLAGLEETATKAAMSFARGEQASGKSRLLLGRDCTSARLAAMVNSTAAHALDWDDYAFGNHPSAVLVPVILALGEETGCSGATMVRAYVAGYEVWGALMSREPDHLHGKGWHPTGLFGPIAAAAASAVVLDLDATMTRHAVAIAASHAGGILANFGTSTKPYHGGKAAESGITAALLARAGLDAGENAIEDRLGLLAALSPAGRVDRTSPLGLGRSWLILKHRLNIKKYPTVGASQRTIDSMLAYVARNPIDAEQVKTLRPFISEKQAAVMPFHTPRTSLEAKFSLEFVTAAPLLARRFGLAEVSDAFLKDPRLAALMAKVVPDLTAVYDPEYSVAAPEAYVTIEMQDGTIVRTPPVHRATGHADVPLPAEDIWAKFADCARSAGLSDTTARRLFDAAQRVDSLSDASALNVN
jgi:aconitate decarboxylase